MTLSITGLNKFRGAAGLVVRIFGTDLDTVVSVHFGDAAAAFTLVSSGEVTATVPRSYTASSVVSVTDASGNTASTAFQMLFAGPWIQSPSQTKTITYVISGGGSYRTEGSSEFRAAQANLDHTDGTAPAIPTAAQNAQALAGARYGLGSVSQDNFNGVWHSYAQSRLNVGWGRQDLIDETIDFGPTEVTREFDFTNADTAATHVDVSIHVVPGSVGGIPSAYTDTEVRFVTQAPPFTPRISPGPFVFASLLDWETAPNAHVGLTPILARREFAAGAGDVVLNDVDPALFYPSSSDYVLSILVYTGSQAVIPAVLATPTAGDPFQYVYWAVTASTTFTFMPVPTRGLFANPTPIDVIGSTGRVIFE